MRTIITVIYLFFFLLFSIPYLGITGIIRKSDPEKSELMELHRLQRCFRTLIRFSGMKLTVLGEENVPQDEAVLYIGNHRSFFDIVTSYTRVNRLTGYIGKDSLKKVPVFQKYMERLHGLLLDRNDNRQGLKVILTAIDYVKKGVSMTIYPEGTRNKDTNPLSILPFKEGSFKIATKTGCKIIPMAIIGSDNVLENHFPWIRPVEVTLIYGQPIDPKSMSKEEQKHLGVYTQQVILDMIRKHLGIAEEAVAEDAAEDSAEAVSGNDAMAPAETVSETGTVVPAEK